MRMMRLGFLLVVAGAVAAQRLVPPLGLFTQWGEGPPKVSCIAPRSYAGSTFELFAVGAGDPTRSVSAKPDQHMVDFTLDGAVPASRCYQCRYRSYNGSAWQTSEFSAEIVVNASGDAGCHPPTAAPTGRPLPTSTTLQQDRPWLLPVAVGAAVLVLLLLAVAAVTAWRVETRRQRAKRQEASCWTETRFPTTELSYDNCAYAVGMNTEAGAGGSTGTSPASPQRHPPASPAPASPAPAPHFSTFRSLA
ncbi:protein HIDE1 [Phalacrocorax carbo]|uniref:protein HIDE1 n=1 Tax=Phalacrocorax carbo TaxID=9209 RepID=UPI00311A5448